VPSHSADLMVNCLDCQSEKHFNKYEVKRERHINYRCKTCAIKNYYAGRPKQTTEDKAKYRKEYYRKHREKLDAYSNDWRQEKRLEIINELGGQCNHCGENDPIVLDIDHIHNDGAQERKTAKRKNVVSILRAKGIDKQRYQLLCKNCNWRKEFLRRRNAELIKKAA